MTRIVKKRDENKTDNREMPEYKRKTKHESNKIAFSLSLTSKKDRQRKGWSKMCLSWNAWERTLKKSEAGNTGKKWSERHRHRKTSNHVSVSLFPDSQFSFRWGSRRNILHDFLSSRDFPFTPFIPCPVLFVSFLCESDSPFDFYVSSFPVKTHHEAVNQTQHSTSLLLFWSLIKHCKENT